MRLADLEHSSLQKVCNFYSRRVPIYVHPSFYKALKLIFLLEVGGFSTELGIVSLGYAIGILLPMRPWFVNSQTSGCM